MEKNKSKSIISEVPYTIELTDRQMASVSVVSTGYLFLVFANNGYDPITSKKLDLDVFLAIAEVLDVFNKAIGTPDGQFPDLIEKLRKLITDREKN